MSLRWGSGPRGGRKQTAGLDGKARRVAKASSRESKKGDRREDLNRA